jgi:hypothetical protein
MCHFVLFGQVVQSLCDACVVDAGHATFNLVLSDALTYTRTDGNIIAISALLYSRNTDPNFGSVLRLPQSFRILPLSMAC